MALDQPENRDHLTELKRGLEIMFGENLKSFELKHDDIPTYAMGSRTFQRLASRYTLSVQVDINISDMLKEERISALTKVDFNIEHSSISMSHIQDYSKGKVVMRLEYVTQDLNAFLDSIKDKTWGKYEQQFTDNLERILADDTHKK